MNKGLKYLALWLPLGLFALFMVLFMSGLFSPAERTITSKMVGKNLPEFSLPMAFDEGKNLTQADFADGTPKMLNIFGSWCVPCRVEAPQLEQIKQAGVPIIGVALRDKESDIARFLADNGNPFTSIIKDDRSTMSFLLGASGVPETYIINGKGIITYQHIGEIRPENVPELIEKWKAAQ